MEDKKPSLVLGKHALLMIACCVIPLLLLGAVLAFEIDLGSVGLVAVMLLCPLLHILMMRGMGHDHRGGKATCHETSASEATAAALPEGNRVRLEKQKT